MKQYIRSSIYYNTRNLPNQAYTIISHMETAGRWTSQKMIEQTMYPWKHVTPDREISYYEIEGEDGERFKVDGDTLRMAVMNHAINVTNARIEGYELRYWNR